MKYLHWLFLCTAFGNAYAESFDWRGFEKAEIELKLPLLTVVGQKGFLACGYINADTCTKTGEACAVVSGVKTHEDMLSKPVIALSEQANALGIELGMSGAEALELMR